MDEQIDADEFAARLDELLTRVQAGEEFVIMWGGRPIARLVPYRPSPSM